MEHMQGINDFGTVFVALAVTISTLFVGAGVAIWKVKNVKLAYVIGAAFLFVGFMVWRSYAPFILPLLAMQAQLAVLAMHFGAGLVIALAILWLVRKREASLIKKAKEETKADVTRAVEALLQKVSDNKLPGPQFSTALLQTIEKA